MSEVRVGRAEISSKFVEGFTPDERAGRHVQHAVFGIEFIDRRAAATCVALAEDILKVAMQQFVDTITHKIYPWLLTGAEPRSCCDQYHLHPRRRIGHRPRLSGDAPYARNKVIISDRGRATR